MKMKKIFLATMLMLGTVSASAQGQQEEAAKTVYDFQPHWYVTVQPLGMQMHRGEVDFSDLLRYNIQAAIGYNFNEYLGARLAVNGWKNKNGVELENLGPYKRTYEWSYVSPTVDLTFNVSNAVAGFNPKRFFNLSLFAGLGANIAWGNDEAKEVQADMFNKVSKYGEKARKDYGFEPFALLWDGSKVNIVGQGGVMADFRLSDRINIGLELQANVLPDNYNSKRAGNADWYFNALAGLKIALGDTYSTHEESVPVRVIEKVVDRVVEKPVYIEKPIEVIVVEPLRRDVFFAINSERIANTETPKIDDIVSYLNQHVDAKVTVTGYADKGTGNATINKRLGEGRAKVVFDTLVKRGIDPSRITVDSKGDTEQPFAENNKNRVTICIAE